MATFYSKPARLAKGKFTTAVFLFLAAARLAFAGQTNDAVFAARAAAEFHRAQSQFQTQPDDSTNAWQFARACYDWAEFAKGDSQRADIAHQGIAAMRQLIAHEPKNVAAHYYLAMNYGQLARTEWFGALHLVKEMEREFKTAASLNNQFDFAGAERNLGLLYQQAPSFGSIGNQHKARAHLERAVQLAPDYPENHLNLAEAFLKWREPDHARAELNALDALWSKAQTNFTGEKWESSWDDWSTRRAADRKKLDEISAPVKPPRHQTVLNFQWPTGGA